MFSRIRSLFRRDNHIHAETRPRQREVSLLSHRRIRQMERSGRRSSEYWAGQGELPGGGWLELVLPGVGRMI